ncbi:putative oxidoreductase YjmC [Oratosquilla oratoria]|uniref:putative oxidoreductase YjmC n=1 Tax=Oratosquilla oratoria TaxID=337810 RepID=UPI003F7750CE
MLSTAGSYLKEVAITGTYRNICFRYAMSLLPATWRWAEQIIMRGSYMSVVTSSLNQQILVAGQTGETLRSRRCYHASCRLGINTESSLQPRNKVSVYNGVPLCKRVIPLTSKGFLRIQHRCNHIEMADYFEKKNAITAPEDLGTQFKKEEIHRFMVDCMVAVGTPKFHATSLADVLLAADYRGHYSHGMNRLEMYVRDGHTKIMAAGADPVIEKESVSTALVNGQNGLGPVVGNFAMDLAIAKAKETGIGWVCARGSNHYGIAGWYSMRASKQGLLGMSFTNTSPLVAPTRSKEAVLGTNPISLAAPSKGDDYVLDMATCVVAVGKIEVQRRKEEPIPEGWAIDKKGQMTTNAAEGMNGALMPLGGPEIQSGYKGYGLGMLVEIFCGILSGGHYGPHVRRWMDTGREADLGQCFVAIDPSFFAPGFEDRMSDLMDHCRNLEPSDPEKPVLIHGDPERSHMAKVDKQGFIEYHINQVKDSWKLAEVLQVKPMESV